MPPRADIRVAIIDHLWQNGPTTLSNLTQMIWNEYKIHEEFQKPSKSRPALTKWEIRVQEVVFELARWNSIQRIGQAVYDSH